DRGSLVPRQARFFLLFAAFSWHLALARARDRGERPGRATRARSLARSRPAHPAPGHSAAAANVHRAALCIWRLSPPVAATLLDVVLRGGVGVRVRGGWVGSALRSLSRQARFWRRGRANRRNRDGRGRLRAVRARHP